MDAMTSDGSGALGWAPVEACTLPTVERPLRLAEFDDLFETTLLSVEKLEPTRARLLLIGDEAVAARTRRLADAEGACCSFFTFGVATDEPGLVTFDIEVPEAYASVLAGLVARAEAGQRRSS